MATARDEQSPYEGGGAGGKFRKRPFRGSVHATPYDRPPANPAILGYRNPTGATGGWLSKLVDPAQRLIASGANRLFSSVFRKRLNPPEPPLSLPETSAETQNKPQAGLAPDFHGVKNTSIDQRVGTSASGGELTDLEQVLKQKTFTRFEIDRLTALLHSRTVDLAIDDKDKRLEVALLKQGASTGGEEGLTRNSASGIQVESEEFPKTPASENRIENQLVSTPAVNTTVREGGVASPTELVELAKSYMHRKPTSQPMLGFRHQASVDNSTAMFTRGLNSPSRLPFTPLVPRITSGHTDNRENGFITPRSRGRSAIYSMARTPYSRIQPTNASKGVENAADIYGGASSSQYATGAQKRRSSVLQNDIGSFGPIRRIRQKPNLLSSRGLSLPVSGSSQNPSSSRMKPRLLGEALHHTVKPSAEDWDNHMPNTTVPSKSSEMASKILQQLDKLVSPKDKLSEPKVHALMDKSPGRLSPSMLRGQALKSLEHVDSSKFLGDAQHNKLIDGSSSKMVAYSQESISQEQVKVKENGPLKIGSSHYNFASNVNGSAMLKENGEDSTLSKKDAVLETHVPASLNSVAYPPQKKRAFQMSAPEDFVDLDDDSLPNGTVSDSLPEGSRKVNFSVAESINTASEYVKLEKSSGSTEVNPMATEMLNRKTDLGTSTGSMTAEKSTNFISQNAYSPSTTVMPGVINTDSSVSPPFNFGGKIVSAKDTNAAVPTFNFGLQTAEKAPDSRVTFSSPPLTFGHSSDLKPNTSTNIPKAAAGATDILTKLPEPAKVDNGNSAVSSRAPETVTPSAASTSNANMFFSSTSKSNNGSLMNGSVTSMSSTPLVFNTLTNQNLSGSGNNISASTTSAFTSTAGSLVSSSPTLSVPAASVFKFGSSTPSTTGAPVSKTSSEPVTAVFNFGSSASVATPVSETSPAPAANVFKFASSTIPTAGSPASDTSLAPTPTVCVPLSGTTNASSEAIRKKQEVSVGNLSGQPATTASTASSLFSFAASTASTSANQLQSSIFEVGNVSAPSAQATAGGTGVATFTQSIPVQFGSSASSPTFGLSGSVTSGSGSITFGSTLDAKAPSTITSSGLSSMSSAGNSVSSNSSSASSVFGTTWQQPKSPVFSFTSSPSTGYSFSASSTPSAATNSAPSTAFSFKASAASSTAPSSSPSTGFSFVASSGPSIAANSSQSAAFSFGSSTSSAATNSSLSAGFSFGSSTPSVASNSSPSTGFSFNASSAPTVSTSPSPFGVSAPSVMNGAPMAFGSNGAASSSPQFAFNSSSTTAPTQPVFGNPSPGFGYGAAPANNDQMSMEDSMAEDTIQASPPAASIFGQPQPISQSPSAFTFGSTAAPPGAVVGNPFQFGGQPNLGNQQNPSPFQASGSLGNSNFSMGSGGSGVDKSNRKFVKVKHKQRKK